MIVTVTVNPAIDKSIRIDNFTEGAVNRVMDIRIDAGGKGINVSKAIKKLGGETKVLGFIAGKAGDIIIEYLDEFNINHDLIRTDGETRTNIKIVDKDKGIITDINEKGQEIKEREVKDLIEKVKNNIKAQDIIVLAGSVPKGIKNDIYKELITIGCKKKAKTFLDADGELLIEGIKAMPYLIKPNIHELESMCKTKFKNKREIFEAARKIIESGVENVFISMGGDGSLFVNKDRQIYIEALRVDIKNTVGAGDSLVASMAYALERKYSLEKALKLSTAAAALSVMTEGTGFHNIDKLKELEEQVKLVNL